MYKRKLQALKFNNPGGFDINDVGQYRSTVVWLEDQRIRHYKVEERHNLRDIKSANWDNHFTQYLKDLECPIPQHDKNSIFDWLLGWAIHLEYEDNASKYKQQTADSVIQSTNQTPTIVTANPLDNLAFNSEEFIEGVNNLAKLLNMAKHPDHLVTLKAICELVTTKLNADVIKNPSQYIATGKPYPLKEFELGFETGDYVLNQAAKVLRLLFIHDVRDLQTKINEIIVVIQNLTANPKTDSSLGQVGR
ncbi:hypothetical protein CHUAL_003727 [Chamberlinius hualienensis]